MFNTLDAGLRRHDESNNRLALASLAYLFRYPDHPGFACILILMTGSIGPTNQMTFSEPMRRLRIT